MSGVSFPAKSGAARAAIRSPTGAMAMSVSAAARAMITLLDGTLCAPMALRTICSTVAIFTNAVTVMNANGQQRDERQRDDQDDRPAEEVVHPRAVHHGLLLLARGRPSARASTSANGAPRRASTAGSSLAGISPSLVNPPSPTPTTKTCVPTFTR